MYFFKDVKRVASVLNVSMKWLTTCSWMLDSDRQHLHFDCWLIYCLQFTNSGRFTGSGVQTVFPFWFPTTIQKFKRDIDRLLPLFSNVSQSKTLARWTNSRTYTKNRFFQILHKHNLNNKCISLVFSSAGSN